VATKLVRFKDGVLVEVGVQRDPAQLQMSHRAAEELGKNFEVIAAMLKKVCSPVVSAFTEMGRDTNRPVSIESAEVELGLGFEAEGNLFVTKATAEATLKVKLTLKPAEAAKK